MNIHNKNIQVMNLYRKIFFLLIVSVFIPVFFLGYMSYNQFSQQLEKATYAFLSDNLNNNVRRLDELFTEVEQRSVEIYSSEALQQLLKESNQDQLDEVDFIREVDKIRYSQAGLYDLNIYPVDMDKYPNYNTLRNNMPTHNTGWFQQALHSDGRGFWLQETSSNFGSTSSDFYFIRPIRSIRGFDTIGVMMIRVPSLFFEQTMIISKDYPNYKLTVIDQQGNNLISQDLISFGPTYFSDSKELSTNGWRVAATIPLSEVTGPIEKIRSYTLLVLFTSLTVITLLLAIITNNIVIPIKNVVRHMKKVNQGALETTVKYVTRKDEIGQLARGYNSMIGGLKELLKTTKESEVEKRKLELQMLINQINPHFLYNTLDSIKWKAEMANESNIAEMVKSLANLLRFSLNEGEEITTLEREIEHVKCYVNIEMLRKGGFQVLYHIQPNLMNVPFMKLILQPIVENAIRHGLDYLSKPGGKILISVYREENELICLVEDNGRGCEESVLEQINATDYDAGHISGLGLRNVKRRLSISFGHEFGIRLENKATSGLRVIVRHPMLEHNY